MLESFELFLHLGWTAGNAESSAGIQMRQRAAGLLSFADSIFVRAVCRVLLCSHVIDLIAGECECNQSLNVR